MSKPATTTTATDSKSKLLNGNAKKTDDVANPNEVKPVVELTETEKVQLQCDNAVLEVLYYLFP